MAAPGRAFLLIFAVNLGVQGFFLTKVPERFVRPHTRYETTAVAMSLYERGEFADPYCLPTGATAHMPPAQPALLAALYRLLGPSLAAGYVAWLVNIGCLGAMFAMLPWLAVRLGLDVRAGLLGGLAGAVVPRWPGFTEPLAAVAIGLMAVVFVRRWTADGAPQGASLALGLALGLSFHVTPVLLPVAAGFLAFEIVGTSGRSRWRRVAAVLLGMAIACVPWTFRNHERLGGLVFIRSNFGLELRMGNHEGAGANLDLSARGGTERHPRTNEEEARKVARLGELAYMRAAGSEAAGWIRSHPGEFLRLTGLRVFQFWFGPLGDPPLMLAISALTVLSLVGVARAWPRLDPPRRAALLVPLLAFPLVYYVVGFEARYREPLDGLAFLLAATAVVGVPLRNGASAERG